MRDIEKGVLLAEFFDADTSKYVPSFISWIKNTEVYSLYKKKYLILKNKRTWKARRYYSYFESISFDDVTSIKDAMIEYGKICYLVKITSESSYVNPLIVENLDQPNMTIGDIKIEFDGKIIVNNKPIGIDLKQVLTFSFINSSFRSKLNPINLRQLCKLEGFSFERKEELIKEKVNNWVNEIETSIINPIEEYKQYSFYLPKIKKINKSRIFELVYLLILNTFMIVINFINIPLFSNIFANPNSLECSFYVFFLGLVLVYDLIFIITLINRKIRYSYYSKARDAVLEDIAKEKDKCEIKLRNYLYKELATAGEMNAKISEFSKTAKYYKYIGYIRKRIAMKKRVKVDKMNAFEKSGLIITFLLLIAFLLIVIL